MFKLAFATAICLALTGNSIALQAFETRSGPTKDRALAFGGVVLPATPNVRLTQASVTSRQQVTYLINGLASNVASIGYGFTNLSKKIPNSELYNYASPVESSTYILSKVRREILQARRRNPNLRINLIGISFGANIVTVIATDLKRSGVDVNYLATIEGTGPASGLFQCDRRGQFFLHQSRLLPNQIKARLWQPDQHHIQP